MLSFGDPASGFAPAAAHLLALALAALAYYVGSTTALIREGE